jgi:putative Holliday junction resolvase
MSTESVKERLKNKRILAIDYGRRRIGLAVCDIMHITVTPKLTIDTQKTGKFDAISDFINKENIDAVVVGIPYRNDDKNRDFIEEIKNFIEKLKEITGLDVYEQDEAFSSRDALDTMINIGYGKKKRREKSNKDKIAAAIILKHFLESIE